MASSCFVRPFSFNAAMRRRLQAQRKFAQSVAVPAHAQPPPEAPPAPPPPARVHFTNHTAANLLDVVSNQNIHEHTDLYVVLERMGTKDPGKTETVTPGTKKGRGKAKITNPGKRVTRSQTLDAARPISEDVHDSQIKAKKNKRIKKNNPQHAAKRVTRSKTIDARTASSEDEMPLKYFKSHLENGEGEPSSREPAAKTNEERPAAAAKKIEEAAAVSKFAEIPAANPKDNANIVQQAMDLESDIESVRLVYEDEDEDEQMESELLAFYGDSGIQAWMANVAPSTPASLAAVATPITPTLPAVTDRVAGAVPTALTAEPATPGPSNEALKPDTPPTKPETRSAKVTARRKTLVQGEAPDKTNTKTSFAKPATRSAKLCARPKTVGPPTPPTATDDAGSSCPSRAYTTVGSVLLHRTETQTCGGECSDCDRFQTVKKVLCDALVEHEDLEPKLKGQTKNLEDVYDFDAARDEGPVAVTYRSHNKKVDPKKKFPTPPPSVASTVAGETRLYFDIPDASKIIEMTSFRPPRSNKTMMNARLIPRSEAIDPKGNSLVKHDILLDHLLQMAPLASKTEKSEQNGNFVHKNNVDVQVGSLQLNKKSKGKALQNGATPVKGNRKSTSTAVPEKHVLHAPTFHPTPAEFTDPIAYIDKIAPQAAKFGICKIVAPAGFKPECVLDEGLNFNVTNQYIAKLYSRWGPCAREMAAIKLCLSTQGVNFKRPPLMSGIELSLPKLYAVVQKFGGLNKVNEQKKWTHVAEEMGLTTLPNPDKKLDSNYVKYLVPYETLLPQERQQITSSVENAWLQRNGKLQDWAFNPLQRQKKLLGEVESSDSEADEENEKDKDDVKRNNVALSEAEDCVVKGRKMNLTAFKTVAQNAQAAFLRDAHAHLADIENEYWRIVLLGTEHVCVNAASIDTGEQGYGFNKGPHQHPWNLKMLSANNGNVLRSLGAVLGVTVPTLHLGMVFSTSCWHRDPHGLPWVEYMHQGTSKIWYGIPNEQSANFRKAVEALCPTSCQNKSIWLPSDITMIPPKLLREHNVSLSRLVQGPGEYIVVFPKAYSCSISTGFTVSESVYFAPNSWLNTVHQVFQELRESCEPTTFSLEQLLISIAKDPRAPLSVLPLTHAGLTTVVRDEQRNRRDLRALKVKSTTDQSRRRQGGVWNVRDQAECEVCRATLYLSKVTGLTTGRQSAVCLAHAIQMLAGKHAKANRAELKLVEYYTDQELDEILHLMQKKLM